MLLKYKWAAHLCCEFYCNRANKMVDPSNDNSEDRIFNWLAKRSCHSEAIILEFMWVA